MNSLLPDDISDRLLITIPGMFHYTIERRVHVRDNYPGQQPEHDIMPTRREALKQIGNSGVALALAGVPARLFSADKRTTRKEVHLFSKHLQWLDYPEMAETAAAAGFDGIDLTVRPGGHVLPENVEKDLPRAVEQIRKAGIKANRITTAVTDPDDPLTTRVLATARDLDIGIYRMGWLKYDRDRPLPEQLESHRSRMESLALLNERVGIHGAYQNHSGTGVGSPVWDAWILVRDLDPSWLGIRYDVRHATVEGTKSWELGLQLLASHIRSLDIKDFHWVKSAGKWDVESVPLGTGAVDFHRFFELLDKWRVYADMTLHLEYPLGGADKGKSELSIPPEEVTGALRRDREFLKKFS